GVVRLLDHVLDRRVRLVGVRVPGRAADRGYAQPAQVERPDRRANALAHLDRDRAGRVPQQHGEFLAAVTGRDVVLADGADDRAGDRPQDLVADLVAVAVVEALELVDVDHQHANGVLGPAAPGEQRAEPIEVASVREPGQGVRGGAG